MPTCVALCLRSKQSIPGNGDAVGKSSVFDLQDCKIDVSRQQMIT